MPKKKYDPYFKGTYYADSEEKLRAIARDENVNVDDQLTIKDYFLEINKRMPTTQIRGTKKAGFKGALVQVSKRIVEENIKRFGEEIEYELVSKVRELEERIKKTEFTPEYRKEYISPVLEKVKSILKFYKAIPFGVTKILKEKKITIEPTFKYSTHMWKERKAWVIRKKGRFVTWKPF